MEVYGKQLEPIFQAIFEAGGVQTIRPDGGFFHRAVTRALLSNWQR
jgi:hypothetical protein